MDSFPEEILQFILDHLSVRDLCQMALCSRSWRELANQDGVWRSLCRGKGWEQYGTVVDLCTEAPFAKQADGTGFNASVGFSWDSLVTGSDSLGLMTNTCKWKEVYMKAQHLEANWSQNRYHIVEFEFGAPGSVEFYGNIPKLKQSAFDACETRRNPPKMIRNLAGDGDWLAVGIVNHSLQIWDMSSGERRHSIAVDVTLDQNTLKMKNGILVAGCTDGKIRSYSAKTGEQLQVMSGHSRSVSRLFFDGDTIVSVAQPSRYDEDIDDDEDDDDEDNDDEDSDDEWQPDDNDVWVWSAADGTSCYTLSRDTKRTRLVQLDYLDKTVAGAYSDHAICVWDATNGSLKHTINTGLKRLISCHLGDGLVIGTNNNNDPVMKMWDLQSGNLMGSFDVPDADLYKDNTFQVNKFAAYYFNGELLIARSAWGVLASVSLDGKYLGDTKSPERFLKLVMICLRGDRLIAADYLTGKMFLWRVAKDGAFRLVKELRPVMNDEIDSQVFSVAWMSDTKMAFVHYFEESEERADELQVPKIVIHHYW